MTFGYILHDTETNSAQMCRHLIQAPESAVFTAICNISARRRSKHKHLPLRRIFYLRSGHMAYLKSQNTTFIKSFVTADCFHLRWCAAAGADVHSAAVSTPSGSVRMREACHMVYCWETSCCSAPSRCFGQRLELKQGFSRGSRWERRISFVFYSV